MHFFSPKGVAIDNKNIVFILDSSGSMSGTKMEQVKAAMAAILDQLRPGAYFNVVDFDSTVSVMETGLVAATLENKEKAKRWVQVLKASGGR